MDSKPKKNKVVQRPQPWRFTNNSLGLLTHNPPLFACLHESMSCVYVFFSTCLSVCVLRAACLVFCGNVLYLFHFYNINLHECRCTLDIVDMTLSVPSSFYEHLLMCVHTSMTHTQCLPAYLRVLMFAPTYIKQ